MARRKTKLLRFNSNIYKKKAIEEAISAYSEFAKFSISKKGKYITVNMDRIVSSLSSVISDEFANYVLGMTKKCSL